MAKTAKFVPAPRLVGIEPNPGPGDVGNGVSEERRWRIIFMHKDLKKTPYKIAQELKMNETTVHNIIEKYAETGTVHSTQIGKKTEAFQQASSQS